MKDLCYQITAVLFSSHQTAALVCNPQTIPFPASMPTLLPNFQTILPHFHFHFDRFTLKCGQSTCSCDDMTSHYEKTAGLPFLKAVIHPKASGVIIQQNM